MDFTTLGAFAKVDALMKDLKTRGQVRHVGELEAYGAQIVPSDAIRSSVGFVEHLSDVVIATFEKLQCLAATSAEVFGARPRDRKAVVSFCRLPNRRY